MDFENPERFRQHSFSDTMLLALSKRPGMDNPVQTFPVQQLLPALAEPHEPLLLVLTSLHCKGQILGYIATSYQNSEDIHLDELYLDWCDAAANGLNTLQQKQYTAYIRQQMERLSIHDPATGLRNRRGLSEQLPDFLLTCRKSQCRPILLLITCTDKMPVGYDTALLAKALQCSILENAIVAIVEDRLFAVLLTEEPSLVIRTTENAMHDMLGENIHPPQLITFSTHLKCQTLSKAENAVNDAIRVFQQKAEADYFPDYKEQLHHMRWEMQAAPQREWSITEIAKQIGISRRHLQRLYKEMFQASITDDLIAARLSKAKQLLTHTEMRIAEIAIECGYRSETHFMRQFKEKNGITPTKYKKQIASE